MSQPKLTLRPPPNVDFVQGYPGIPPGGPDRPQAAVKGAIEVRLPQQGVKAKWVRIELRKIETLPGGGVANTFFDFVGQSPINLWQSPNDEYTTLYTHDFPFFIRIPESIPPTIALEKGAGIKYELIASVCVQGKKGFLRRDKPTITATASPIIIDKHELHSTWPIYSQPETRNHSQDGVTLMVERSHTCYGPGDRVVVMATVKSDTLHTVMLRGFEFMLRETTIFRAAPHTQGKKGSPQVKVSSIGEQKVPVNVTLYGGTQHKAELSVTVPPHHTSATINAARHIDINYVLTVKALMSTGQPIIMDLPIMISNWPRAVSVEAMRRIGHAFNVSLPGHTISASSAQSSRFAPSLMGTANVTATSPSHTHSSSIDQKSSVTDIRSPAKVTPGQYNTVPPNSDRNVVDRYGSVNEFGERKKSIDITGPSYPAQTIGATNYSTGGSGSGPRARASSGASSYDNHGAVPAARPRSSNGRGTTSRPLTIVNTTEEERAHLEAEAERTRRQPSTILESPISTTPPPGNRLTPSAPTPKTSSSALSTKWPTAEQEKVALYNRAMAQVERIQPPTRSPVDGASQNGHSETISVKSPTPVTPATATSTKTQTRWATAEEEKARLFQEAQAAVARARGIEGSESSNGATGSSPYAGGSSSAGASGSTRSPSMSAGAALYSEAMSAINKPVTSPAPVTSPVPVTPASAVARQPSASASNPVPSAADEKAMLQRYYEAKNAVWQTQSAHYGQVPGNAEPVPYDALYSKPTSPTPSNPYSSPAVASPPPADQLPPFAASGSSSQHPILSEKERLRRHYEAQDAAAAQQQQPWQPTPPPAQYPGSPPVNAYPGSPAINDTRFSALASPPPPAGAPPPFASPSQPLSAYEEKEMLRRKYAEQEANASPGVAPVPPPRTSQLVNGSGGRGRPPPTPPISPHAPGTPVSARPLTAAEEKARLKAMYEADDRGARPIPVPHQSPYPSPPPSNGYHDPDAAPRTTPSPKIPPPPPLAPKPPREYIEETQLEDKRTTAKLQAIDAAKSLRLADPDLASIASSDDDAEQTDAKDNTFGPGTLSALASGSVSPSPAPGPSRHPSLAVPPPPPLPVKVQIE